MKQTIRKDILKKRNRLSPEEIIEKSKIIEEKLFNSSEYKKAKTVMFYVSFGPEVDTHDMIKGALNEKKVCVPVLENGRISASLIEDFDELDKKNEFGILEPSKIKKIDKKDIELVIVPGVAFDKDNHRIGYGKGCYDGFLKDFKGSKIGLCFDLQIIEAVPLKHWDIGLSKIISEV